MPLIELDHTKMVSRSGYALDSFMDTIDMQVSGLWQQINQPQGELDPADSIPGTSAQKAFRYMRHWLGCVVNHSGILRYDACADHAECEYHNDSALERVKRTAASYPCERPLVKDATDHALSESLAEHCEEIAAMCDRFYCEISARDGADPVDTLPDEPQRRAYAQARALLKGCRDLSLLLSLGMTDTHSVSLENVLDRASREISNC